MIAWRSLSSIGIAFACLCVFLLSHGNFPLWTTCGVTSKLYREGGESWKHLRTGIVVWKDAIDLSAGPGAKAFFHYTGELAFRNIVALEKEAAEVWASLKNGRRKCKRLVGAWCLQPFQNLPTNGQTKQNFWTTILET